MNVGKKVERDAIHCSASPTDKHTRGSPGRVGVETVSSGCGTALLCSATQYTSPSHRGGEPCAGVTASQRCGLQADKWLCLSSRRWLRRDYLPALKVKGRLGHVSDLKQGGKAKWVGRSVLKLNFDLRPFPKMALDVTLGKLSTHRHSRTVFAGPRGPRAPPRARGP